MGRGVESGDGARRGGGALLAINSAREVGVSCMVGGGGTRFPSHVVGILMGTRKDAIVTEGARPTTRSGATT